MAKDPGRHTRSNVTMAVGAVVLVALFAVTAASGREMARSTLWTLLVLQALAAAAVAEGLTGHMNIQGELSKLTVKAGGSLAVAAAVLWAGMKFAEGPTKPDPGTSGAAPTVDGGTLTASNTPKDTGARAPGGSGGANSVNETVAKNFKGSLDLDNGQVDLRGQKPPGEINHTKIVDSDATIKIKNEGVRTGGD